jgi:hypothetical protein
VELTVSHIVAPLLSLEFLTHSDKSGPVCTGLGFVDLSEMVIEPEFGELEFQSQIILIRLKKSHYIAKKISKSNQLFSGESTR